MFHINSHLAMPKMEKTMRLIITVVCAFVVSGCTSETSDKDKENSKAGSGGSGSTSSGGTSGSASDDCNPVGEWKWTMTTGSGDCLPEGISSEDQTLSIDQSDLADIDKAKCQFEHSVPYHEEETYQSYEIEGTLTITVNFEADSFTGTGRLEADKLEAGVFHNSCAQDFSVSGSL